MTEKERTKKSNEFLADLKEIMEKHDISVIRVFQDCFCGFDSEGYGIFQCNRLENYKGRKMIKHNGLNSDWKTYIR